MQPLKLQNFSFQQQSAKGEPNLPLLDSSPFKTLGIIFLILSSVVSLSTYGLMYYFEKKNITTESNIKSIESTLSEVPLTNMLDFYNKVKTINNIIVNKNYISTQLNFLSDAVESETYFKKYSFAPGIETNDSLKLTFISPEYSNVARQLDILRSDKYAKMIKKVNLISIAPDSNGNVSTDVDITFDASTKPDFIKLINLSSNSTLPSSQASVGAEVEEDVPLSEEEDGFGSELDDIEFIDN